MGTILAILGLLNPAGLIAKVIHYRNRPRLEVYYDPNETYIKVPDLAFHGRLGNFAHVMVRNTGRNVAKNCVGELRRIEEAKEEGFESAPGYRSIMPLKWAHEKDFSPKDIEDVPIRLDVCYVHQALDTLHFFTEKYPSGCQTDFPPGRYRIRIRIRSDNARRVEKDFIVKYDAGKFDGLEIQDV